MPRNGRTYAPGVAFHIVAVTQGRERWFSDEISARISSDIDIASASAGHRVLARVVMPNHFHIILKHGTSPLGWTMQRIMQRAVNQVKHKYDLEGHVFQARYWAEPIPTPTYLRRAIVYAHLNPVKAGLCRSPSDYAHSSHNNYLQYRDGATADDVGFRDGLILFAGGSIRLADVVQNYLSFVEFCEERRRNAVPGDWLLPGTPWFEAAPTARNGDEHWLATYTCFDGGLEIPKKAVDARSLAVTLLRHIDPNLDLDQLRFNLRLRLMRPPVRELICGLLTAGSRPSAIARLLNVSPTYVSRIRTQMRFPAMQQ